MSVKCALGGCDKAAVLAAPHSGELLGFCCTICSASYCATNDGTTRTFPPRCDVRVRAHELMEDHVYRTRWFVAEWNANPNGALTAGVLKYLLENQDDIGTAFAGRFGANAGAAVAKLFREHILGAAPILDAAKRGDQEAVKSSVAAWRVNAGKIATAAEGLDAKHFPRERMLVELNAHLDHTIAYSVAIIKGDARATIEAFEVARKHMAHFADVLTPGLVSY